MPRAKKSSKKKKQQWHWWEPTKRKGLVGLAAAFAIASYVGFMFPQ